MKHLKGFITISDLVDNSVTTTSAVGELSATSANYRPDNRQYISDSVSGIRLHLFSTKNSDGSNYTLTKPDVLGEEVLEFASYINSGAKAGRFTINVEVFNNIVRAERPDVAATMITGAMVSSVQGHFYPSYVTWTVNGTEVRIWFADGAFRHQFDEFTIIPISPVESLNDLHRPYSEISNLLVEDTKRQIGIANQISANSPYTSLQPVTVQWYDKQGTTIKDLTWLVVLYGVAGNNPDSINRALREYILANSDFTEVEWFDVHPKLFRPTEFILVPMWHRESIPTNSSQPGIYSPSVNVKEMLDLSAPALQNYDQAHIDSHLEFTANIYKSLAMTAIGGEGNVDGIVDFSERFPDYMLVDTTSLDFNKVSPFTQNWMILMHRQLLEAENANEFSQLDADFSRLKRDGVDFIVSTYDGVNYLVVQRTSFMDYYNDSSYSTD